MVSRSLDSSRRHQPPLPVAVPLLYRPASAMSPLFSQEQPMERQDSLTPAQAFPIASQPSSTAAESLSTASPIAIPLISRSIFPLLAEPQAALEPSPSPTLMARPSPALQPFSP